MLEASLESITDDVQEALRSEVRQIIESEGLTQAFIAREAGLAPGTFTPWLGGTYKGDNVDKARAVQRWLETRQARGRTAATLPAAPKFVATLTATNILDVLAYAQTAPDFGVIVGGAGIGKTTAIEEYARRASNVFVVTAEPVLASPNNMLSALADVVTVAERRSVYLSRAISAKLRGTAGLIVIDEGQHLSSAALDQLRTIHDKAQIGVVVAGNESVFSRLQGGERNSQFAQLYSRVGMRMSQPKARAKDICALLEAWKITDARVVSMLKLVAAKPGALRQMTKVIRLATMLAAGDGADALSEQHVRRAWNQLASTPLDAVA
ncbi:AAA family ATPase [Kaistia dalseonensis]|uniref:DNA transposition AAA+ family ATPase n=1 Tax=Kaistia dalseonensis TaxID=410840 RepID=A0ABU0HDW5_9HYPH|nr:AAA family ATPase [Kaistia dalseonensis]MCX5497293.1 AAA family ATPase [Kaistia dalseonensis]MDQ0439930.1 DNA transposition AAA+ family ATPase [Kaistia dalseonensis]